MRVGVVGLGVGEQHLIGYRRHPACDLVAVCDLSGEKLALQRREFPEILTTQSARDILESPEIDLVSIASYDDAHFEQVIAALEAGKHVFIEKPLCQSLAQLRQIKSAWSRHGGRVKLKSNLVLRAAPLYRWLRQQVQAGALGELFAFDGDYLYGRLAKITVGWRGDVDDYSVIAGGGVHLIDLLLWITQQRPAVVMAYGNGICSRGTKFRYHDYVAAMARCPSGLVARITSNYGCVHGHQHVVRIFGTRATFIYDDQGARWQAQRDPAPPAQRLSADPLPPNKYALIGDFADAVLADADLGAETQCDFDTVSVCTACNVAIEKQSPQEVHYV